MYSPPPQLHKGEKGVILESLCPSVPLSMCPDHVEAISPEPLDLSWSNFVRWCIIIRQSVIAKDWCANFKVKVTVRDFILKIWFLLLYFPNCWTFCHQTLFNGASSWAGVSCEKKNDCSGSKPQQKLKCQWLLVWIISPELLNLL